MNMQAKRTKIFSAIATWAAIGVLLLAYAWIQADDDMHKQIEADHKAETIKAAKAEFSKQQKWAGLDAESTRLTFPVAAYSSDWKQSSK